MAPRFIKFHGFGNDYIVIESRELGLAGITATPQLGDFARRICNRHYGAGADGIAVVSPSEDPGADFHVRIFNPDASEASLSGNGTRCAAAYLYYKKLWTAEELRLSTRAGIKLYTIRERWEIRIAVSSLTTSLRSIGAESAAQLKTTNSFRIAQM